jgi:hypothetical protein
MHAPIAQSVEQLPFKEWVVGSIPTGRTITNKNMISEDKSTKIGEVTSNPNVIIGKSRFGRGLFALNDLAKNEIIAEFDGDIYTARLASLLPNDPPLFIQDHAVQFSDTQYRYGKFGVLINHSCEPNCGVSGKNESFRIVSMRPIKKDEELVWDYEMTEDSDWSMECECGTPVCRKRISAYRNMPKEIKKKYKGYIQSYLIEKYGEPE